MMQGELTDALIDALRTLGNDVSVEETVGGMVLIREPQRLWVTREALSEAAGFDVPVATLNPLTVAIVGRTRYWTDEGFEITDD